MCSFSSSSYSSRSCSSALPRDGAGRFELLALDDFFLHQPACPARRLETDVTVAGFGSVRTGAGGRRLRSSVFFFPPNRESRNSLGGSGSTWCEALRSPSSSSASRFVVLRFS